MSGKNFDLDNGLNIHCLEIINEFENKRKIINIFFVVYKIQKILYSQRMTKPTYYTSKKLSEIGIDDRVLRKTINYNLNFDEK